ncbi:amino acid adenylation domain-containing protein [Lysobacter enzymogenes]|uniref:non-ribosomal peptide synthetase n=1 Tax=Lysobacter enzymogenes TaxID=69 RepID=UPI00339AE241
MASGLIDTARADDALDARRHCVHRLFERQAAATPDAIAVETHSSASRSLASGSSQAGSVRLSYGELERRANRLAHRLIAAGVRRGDRVALSLERSPWLPVALLGVLKAGAAYLPIDTRAPAARRAFVLRQAQARAWLCDAGYPDGEHDRADGGGDFDDAHGAPVRIDLDERDDSWTRFAEQPPALDADGRDLMYVLYTSGTTGEPKGVMLEHAGVAALLQWMIRAYAFDGADRVLQKTPYTFDASVWELFLPLLSGGTVVLAEPDAHRDPAYLAATVAAAGITTLQLVPSMLRHVLDQPEWSRCGGLRHLFCGGEALTGDLVAAVHAQFDIPVHNLYGPTEASVQVLTWTCRRGQAHAHVPIGRAIPGVVTHVFDTDGRPVAPGETGELHLGGIALARGYLDRPELTAQRFLQRPGEPAPHHRLYRTGDLVREDADGCFHYAGRIDDQVKVQGNRVELGEIEACLARAAGVSAAAVLAETSAETGAVRLVAFVRAGAEVAPRLAELRAHLAAHLPDYMIPAQFRRVDRFPLTAHGKLDKAALRAGPSAPLTGESAGAAAANELERALSALWSDALGVDEVGVDQDFFELGGDSVSGLLMIAKARRQRIVLTPQELFRLRRIDAIASAIGQRQAAASA